MSTSVTSSIAVLGGRGLLPRACWIAPATAGFVTSSALTTTSAVAFSPGNAAVMRLYVFITGRVLAGSRSMPALAVCMPSAGIGERDEQRRRR